MLAVCTETGDADAILEHGQQPRYDNNDHEVDKRDDEVRFKGARRAQRHFLSDKGQFGQRDEVSKRGVLDAVDQLV